MTDSPNIGTAAPKAIDPSSPSPLAGEGRGEGEPCANARDASPTTLPMQPDATNCNIPSAQPECNITDRHRAAIELLCTGASDGDIAQSLQIHRSTLYRWKTNPHFAAALRARRAALTQQSADRFRSLLGAALDTFQKQISDPYVPTAYRAARGLLALAQLNKLLLPTPDSDPLPDPNPDPNPAPNSQPRSSQDAHSIPKA